MPHGLVTVVSPPVWPFPTPVVPASITATGRSYRADSNSQVTIDSRDLSSLLNMGFSLESSSAFIVSLPVDFTTANDQILSMPSDRYIITDIYTTFAGDAISASYVVWDGPNQSGTEVASPNLNLTGPNDYSHTIEANLTTTNAFWTSTTLYFSVASPIPGPAIANVFVKGFSIT
jgi:hypothetical protein